MKITGAIAISALLLLTFSSAVAEGLTFDRSNLVITGTGAAYTGFDQIPAAGGFDLAMVEFLLPLDDGDCPDAISVSSPHPVNLGKVNAVVFADDITSADSLFQPALEGPRPGSEPVLVSGSIEINGRRYAQLVVFPTTVDSEGELWFHDKLEIALEDGSIDLASLIPRQSLLPLNQTDLRARSTSASLSGAEYVIITAAAMAESLQPLAAYRNETGFTTEIVLIEEITAPYTGRDEAEKIREYLKTFYDAGGRYVLLAGDETIVPIRYAYHYNSDTMPSLSDLQICDLYYAELTGEWDVDGDNVWGERYQDQADLTPELRVGRLPFNAPEEFLTYTDKLIRYETRPGGESPSYLERAFFFSSDQMRDYDSIGQHGSIALAYPGWFEIDTVSAVEAMRGDDITPSNLSPTLLDDVFEPGFGIVNIIAHGRSDGFSVKSSGYNAWPKSLMLTQEQMGDHGCFDSLAIPEKPSFYYSLACSNGAFDMDQEPFFHENPMMSQALLGREGGAVGFVAYSRWGWISSSHLLQKDFFDFLFAHPELPAVEAMYASKASRYYYRDLVYGQNYLGDPALRVHTRVPERLTVETEVVADGVQVTVISGGSPTPDCRLVLSEEGVYLMEATTGSDGKALLDYEFDTSGEYRLAAIKTGATVNLADLTVTMVTSVDDDDLMLPGQFTLHQNYPNPFNPSTVIAFELPERADIKLTVFNVLGQTVTTLADGLYSAGHHEITWDGYRGSGEPASGVYFYRLVTEDRGEVRKMVLLK
jgi:hypothetical protein